MLIGHVVSVGYFSHQDNFIGDVSAPLQKNCKKQPHLQPSKPTKPKRPTIDIEMLFQTRLHKQLEE
jgi:hypothetical protein